MVRRPTAAATKIPKVTKITKKTKLVFVILVDFVIFVPAAVGRLSQAFSAGATSDQCQADERFHVGNLAAAHHVARLA